MSLDIGGTISPLFLFNLRANSFVSIFNRAYYLSLLYPTKTQPNLTALHITYINLTEVSSFQVVDFRTGSKEKGIETMAGGYGSLKMKRKDLDDVNDDFSDFSLSSPARKIRRLDAELPPIMEEEEAMPVANEHSSAMEELGGSGNEERAIVLFKPMNAHLLRSASPNFSVSVDSDIISGFKNQFPWSNQSDRIKPLEEEAQSDEETKECRAVVPWVPSQFPFAQGLDVSPSKAPEEMEAEEMGEAAMDVEEDNSSVAEQGSVFELGGFRGSDGLPQWQQQHCMIPQFPQNNSTPITWFQ